MSAFNSVSEALELYVSPFDEEPQAWADVLRRASTASEAKPLNRRRRRRLLASVALAAAALVALGASPVGGAIARGFGDFSAWLTGSPGEPASEEARSAHFDKANKRSWMGFPDGPKLRRLIVTEAAGGTFELFGFRSGDSLCLHLTVEGIPTDVDFATGCTPLEELRRAEAPAVVSVIDLPFGRQDVPPNEDGFIPARAQVVFGVVADGVSGVELTTNRGGVSHAIVANNTFLAVTDHPPLGVLTREITVTSEDGDRLAVPFAPAVYAGDEPTAKPGVAPGPQEVERRVEGGTIGWLLRREPRGQSIKEAGLAGRRDFFFNDPPEGWEVRFARVVKPDPSGLARVGIGLMHVEASPQPPVSHDEICTYAITPTEGDGMGCMPMGRLFLGGPFNYGLGGGGSDQYVWLDGLASDDVARMELFLASGERVAVPLRDNVFRVEVARIRFPTRLVAYDSEDRAIGIRAETHDPLTG